MQTQRAASLITQSAAVVASCLALSATVVADVYEFRVAFANVPGIDELEAGDVHAGIRILEDRQTDKRAPKYIDEMSTLCAAYVVNDELDEAAVPCNYSVRKFRTMISYNNRGALRANLGDFEGAKEDFDYARSIDEPRYLTVEQAEYVRGLAEHNFLLVSELIARRDAPQLEGGLALSDAN